MTQVPLITGCKGRLGRAITAIIEEEHADTMPAAVFATRDELDVTDYFRLRSEMERIAPTVVINCAAYAHVDGCETNRDLAELVNVEGAGHVARAAAAVGARIIHISTDLVFDGRQPEPRRPYREDDPPNPLSHYAATKLAGEKAVAAENADHTILRSSWFYGPWPAERYPESFLAALREGRRFSMVSDRLGSPTYLRDLARAVATLALTPFVGVLHFANGGEPTSRYHLLAMLAEHLGVPTVSMSPILDRDWKEDVAARPIFSALDASRYAALTGRTPRAWDETFADYAAERRA